MMKVTELEWQVFSLIGSDVSTREIAELLRTSRNQVWHIRSRLGKKLGLHGTRLIVCAVKCVWIQQHNEPMRHISEVFKRFNAAGQGRRNPGQPT